MSVIVLPVRRRRPWWRRFLQRLRYGPHVGVVVKANIHRNVGRRERLRVQGGGS